MRQRTKATIQRRKATNGRQDKWNDTIRISLLLTVAFHSVEPSVIAQVACEVPIEIYKRKRRRKKKQAEREQHTKYVFSIHTLFVVVADVRFQFRHRLSVILHSKRLKIIAHANIARNPCGMCDDDAGARHRSELCHRYHRRRRHCPLIRSTR